ncbi:MAG: cysteine desulfurase [Alphaproteobacteria bacterium]|nr:cysteine desulfurase [Alphaproteobacteria bacterium]
MAQNTRTYLDYNATAPVFPEVVQKMAEILSAPHNASSVHSFGREAKRVLEAARKTIADSISAWPNEVIFCGSGTESNITALRGFSGRRVLVSAVEHSSVLKPSPAGRGLGEGIIPVDKNGIVDLAALEKILGSPHPGPLPAGEGVLVSIMLANNETGVIQPIAEVAKICKAHSAILHCDAVQALGKIPVDFGALGADLLTLSAHKCGGPVGAAALVVRRDLPFTPLFTGGGQESGRRAGTENIAAIAGFAKAAELIDLEKMAALRGWLDAMEAELESYGATVFGKPPPRLPNTSCISMPNVGNEVQLMDFDLAGFAVSAGSACSSGRIEVSHVLTAMGVPKDIAGTAIRVSGGWGTTQKDVEQFTEQWIALRRRLGGAIISG